MLKRTAERKGHLGAIYDLKVADDGFYSAAADGYIVHWHRDDVDFGRVVAKVDGGKFFSLDLIPTGGFVAGALDGGVHWLYPDAEQDNLHVAAHGRPVYAVRRIGAWVFTAGGDGRLIKWSLATRRQIESRQLSANSLRCIASVHDTRLLVGASDGKIYHVDINSLEVLGESKANEPSVFTVAPLPGEATLHAVSGGRDAKLLFTEFASVKSPALPPIDAHSSTINELAFSPNGQYLATASRDKTIKLWRAGDASFTLLKVAEVVRDRGHVNSVNTLLWLDDQTLLSAGDDRRILEWRVGGD